MLALLKRVACVVALMCAWQMTALADAAVPALTKADVDTWLDGFMPNALRQGDIAGAVVVVVKDGSVLTQRGYGVLCLPDLPRCIGCFDMINIKLDKCGGLTEGLAMANVARRLGFKVMVGNMVGTSLAMAPAFLLAQLCDVVDLDGPLALAHDRTPGVVYEKDGRIWCPESVWGAPDAQFA